MIEAPAKVVSINRDAPFQISYKLEDGRESAFRMDPAMADLIIASVSLYDTELQVGNVPD